MRIEGTLADHTEKVLKMLTFLESSGSDVDNFSVFCNENMESEDSERVGSSKVDNEDLRIFHFFLYVLHVRIAHGENFPKVWGLGSGTA